MGEIKGYEYVFPLVGGKSVSTKDVVEIKEVYGTAFYLNNGNYLTAGHALRNALQCEHVGLAYLDQTERWFFKKATAYEVVDDYDIGFVKAEVPQAKAMEWDLEELPLLSDVRAMGFPYALDHQNRFMGIRAFKGHVVSAPTFYRFHGHPLCYELSFQCPRGLSGAPLFIQDFVPNPKVKGIVVGNQSTEMLIFSDREVMQGGKEVICERYEAMQTGIAIQAGSLQGIKSAIIGSSLLDYLHSVSLAK
jgi:hypothetical protein